MYLPHLIHLDTMKFQGNKNKNATLERTSTFFFKAEAPAAKFQENIKVGFLPSKLLEGKMAMGMDYGRPIKLFFIEIQNFWIWADKVGR